MESLLGPYRVLDLTNETGFFCGKVLAEFGADVIKIEPPGGDFARRIGPFYHDIPHPEKSLYWFVYNANKRGITLNIETPDGKDIFKRLAQTVDFVIETFPPGHIEYLGLGYSVLSQLNPGLIMTSITPFGQSGPYKDYKSSDLIAWATGGLLYICGDPDMPPVRCSADVAYCEAGVQSAVATIIAHNYRQLTGEGQHIDVSLQECITCILWQTQQWWDLNQEIVTRLGRYLKRGAIHRQNNFRCKDGHVSWQLHTAHMGRRTKALVEWMIEEGKASEELKATPWEEIDYNAITPEQSAAWEAEFENFFLTHTKAELIEESVKRSIMVFPCNTTEEGRQDTQLAARDFWVEVEHPELKTSVIYPGAPAKLSEAHWQMYRRAPLIGEHNEEIYVGELGFTKDELVLLKQSNVI